MALAGAGSSADCQGLGLSLVFPALGVEAMRRVPAQNRGLAVGAYIAFFDVALALSGPVTAAVVGRFGYASGSLTCRRLQSSATVLANKAPILLTLDENGGAAMLTLGENMLTFIDRCSQSAPYAHPL